MSKKILIVEDSAQDRKIIKINLSKHGYKNLLFASTGKEGIAMAVSKKPDLIILDINMPQMSGVEVHRILKNDPVTRHIPILFNTNLLKAGEFGEDMEKFVAKSSLPDYLIETVKSIIGSG